MAFDAFHVLGLAPSFRVLREAVEESYLGQSQRLHPDVAAGREDAARQMADLNLARRLLVNPETRAEALLTRLGGPSSAQERSLPNGFLAEVMEVRERVEASLLESPESGRAAWESWSRHERERAIEEVGSLFDEVETPDLNRPREEVLREIRVRLNAWRYIERLIEQLDPGVSNGG